ncbi:MAG: ATP-binding protein [Nitrospirota bacterium]|jgi:signal transduction histidine kinase
MTPAAGTPPVPFPLPPHRRLLVRIVGVMVAAILAIEGIILVVTTQRHRDDTRNHFFASAEGEAWRAAAPLAEQLAMGGADTIRPEQLPRVHGASTALFDAEGRLLEATATGESPDLVALVRGFLESSPAFGRTGDVATGCYVLIPLRQMGKLYGALAVTKSSDSLRRESLHYILRTLGVILVICAFTSLVVLLYLVREVLHPVQRIVAANVATGHGTEELIPADDIPITELGEISQTRNRMLLSLRSAREEILAKNRELESWNRTLEDRVAERTAALEQAQERVVQAEKLAAIGKLAASVAHEINNPLGIIAAGAEDLRRQLGHAGAPDRDEVNRSLEIIRSQIQRCKRIVDALLNYSRRRPSAPEVTDLRRFLDETLELVRHRARKEDKPLALDVADPPPSAAIMQTQLQQALINLLDNAIDAADPGQQITVGADRTAHGVAVWVENQGEPIPPEVQESIFEPFFTTKPPGRGAGMGLSIAANFIRAQGGRLRYEDAATGGARFVIELPE